MLRIIKYQGYQQQVHSTQPHKSTNLLSRVLNRHTAGREAALLRLLRAPAGGGPGPVRAHEPVRAVRPPVEGDAVVRGRRELPNLPPQDPTVTSCAASIDHLFFFITAQWSIIFCKH